MANSLTHNPWLACYQSNPQALIRLFCFPHAGAGPQFFKDWHKGLPETVEVCVVQPPGRGSRLKELPYTQMKPLVDAIVKELLPYTDKPFAFFGHSLGGWVSFEVTRQLHRQSSPSPVHLFIASCRAPQLPASGTPSYQLPDNEFIEKMRRGNGVPKEIFANPKLVNLFLPLLRADAELGDTYHYCPGEPINCPISVFGGTEDNVVSQNELKDWCHQTHSSFGLQMFPGDHFFLNNDSTCFLTVLTEQLERHLNINNNGQIARQHSFESISPTPRTDSKKHKMSMDSSNQNREVPTAEEISKHKADDAIDWLRDYASNRINSRLMDERRSISPHIVLDFGNHGIMGMQVSKEYGGLALSNYDGMRVIEQIAAIDLTLATFVGSNNALGIRPIEHYAKPELKEELLPLLSSGRQIAALALTEPNAGSNPRAISSQALPDGAENWHLHGTKIWSGSAAWASVINIFAQLVDINGKPQGITGFTVRQGTPGLRLGSEALTMGMRGMVQNSIYLEGVPVGLTNVLGELGDGMVIAQDTFNFGRLGLGAISLGGMRRIAQLMHRYATRRTIATGRLLDNPITLNRFNNLAAAITATETLVALIAEFLDKNISIPEEFFIACKIAGSEFLWQAADTLVQSLGGRGYLENNIAPQILRDARLLRIFEGPTETLNMYLGSDIIHKPEKLTHFITNTLQASDVSIQLTNAVNEINDHFLATNLPFQERSEAKRLAYSLIGEVSTQAILLAAIQAALKCNSNQDSLHHAALWTQKQFKRNVYKALNNTPAKSEAFNTNKIDDLVSSYTDVIGNLEQNLPGEDNNLDSLLRQKLFLDSSHSTTTNTPNIFRVSSSYLV